LTTGSREPDEQVALTGPGGWHFVAFVAALALVLAMTIDWYTTEQGEEYRRVQEVNERSQDSQRLDSEDIERAEQAAEAQEKNAFQADAFVDRLILLACLAAFLAAVAAALMRSLGRVPDPPWRPSAIATVAGILGTLLILYRMVQPPGLNEAAVVKAGAPIGLAALGILTVASRLATLMEAEERLTPEEIEARDRADRERRARRGRERGPRRGRRRAAAAGEAAASAPAAGAPAPPATAAPGTEPPATPPPGPPAPPPPPPGSAPAAPAAPARLWAPDPDEDQSAEERERRRIEREQARAAREGEPPPDSPQRQDPNGGG
jgi:hypothetical protein